MAAVPLFMPSCRKSAFPYTNATGSMLFRLATRFMTRIATTSFAPLTLKNGCGSQCFLRKR
jgi:hypothetical protein